MTDAETTPSVPASTVDPGAPCYLDEDEAQAWASSVVTAAHHSMDDDYIAMSRTPPPGGVSSLVAMVLALMEELGEKLGMSREQMLQTFCLAKDYSNCQD